mgnify:CR=1 FL=1
MTPLLKCILELRELATSRFPMSVLTSIGIGRTNLRITCISETQTTASVKIEWDDLLQSDSISERLNEIVSKLNKQLR